MSLFQSMFIYQFVKISLKKIHIRIRRAIETIDVLLQMTSERKKITNRNSKMKKLLVVVFFLTRRNFAYFEQSAQIEL